MYSMLLFTCSAMSDSLQPHGLQHTRLPCPSPSPGVCSNSCPLSRWCHPTISSSVVLLLPSIFPSIRVFSIESTVCIGWPMYWSFNFSISPSSEYSGLISFSIDWFDFFEVSSSVQFSSVTQSCPTLCDPMNRSTPRLPVHHQLLEFT